MDLCAECGYDLANAIHAYASVIDGSLVCSKDCAIKHMGVKGMIFELYFEEISTVDIGVRRE